MSEPTEAANVVARIDQTLTFYSTGLDTDLTVKRDQPETFAIVSPLLAQVLERFQTAMSEWADAVAPVLRDVGVRLVEFSTAFQPLVAAVKRRDRWRKVLHRWNEPDLRAAMWDRKMARTGRAWRTRQVDR